MPRRLTAACEIQYDESPLSRGRRALHDGLTRTQDGTDMIITRHGEHLPL